MGLGEWCDNRSDASLIAFITAVVMICVISGFAVLGFYFPSPPILHTNAKITSVYVYDSALFSSRLGTVSSKVSDITLNSTGLVYTISCTYYTVNMTLAMTNNHSYGYSIDNTGKNTPWTIDNLHIGCNLFQVNQP